MLSYIASNPMEDLIKGVCEELNITILSKIGEIDFLQYIKETKVNFKLIKYIIIELKSLKGTEENIINIINEICNIKIDDGVTFEVQKIELIREDDDYGGYRITFKANYMESMPVIMKIDVTTGDKITYKEIKYCFDLMLEDRKIQIWSYNLETVIAEKFESIIKRGILGTRIRDYYDVYMLLNTQTKNINFNTLKDAIYSTAEHRNTINIIKDWSKIIEQLDNSDIIRKQWERYKKDNFYAKEIKYEDLIESLKQVGKIL